MTITSGLKNINMLSKEQYDSVATPLTDELYAVSGSGTGFPSDKYIELTLGASGSEYEAPANGYFYLQMAYVADKYVDIWNSTTNTGCIMSAASSSSSLRAMTPCKKGDIVVVNYTATTQQAFRFIYAEGE